MSKQLAREVFVRIDEESIPGLTDCSLNLTTVFASSQTKADRGPVDEPLRVDWEVSVSGECETDGGDGAVATLKWGSTNGKQVKVDYVVGDVAEYTGKCLVSSYNESAPEAGKVTFQATLKGVSILTSL